MSTPSVTRGIFARHCPTCGWSGTYDTAGRADYSLRRHSCEKHQDKLARRQRHDDRMAAIDRTPKPCLHKQADHQHGTNAAYVLDRCRCEPCAAARKAQDDWRNRQQAYGRYDKYVDGDLVRAHLEALKGYGIGLKKVAMLSGVSNGALTKIWYGVFADTGLGALDRRGQGKVVRPPAKRVTRAVADRILAIEAVPANLGPHHHDHERTPLARAHVRALVALGWSMSELGRRVGSKHVGNFCRIVSTDDGLMYRETVDKIEALFDDLCMTRPPETNQRQRISASRARRVAKERGWLPPLALDDLVDEPDVESDAFDEAAIDRRMHGDKSVSLTTAERFELVRRWVDSGRSLAEMERHTGINSARYREAS